MFNNKSYIFIIVFSLCFTQNIWSGNSVSTSDNLDAFSLNPAGLGIDRGVLTGLYFPIDSENFEMIQGNRDSNFGYLLKYSDSRPEKLIHQPIEFKIGFGTALGKGNYLGLTWHQTKNGEGSLMMMENNFTFCALLRPWNFLSIGGTYSVNEDQNISSNRIGFGIRPLCNHKLTLGADYLMNDNVNTIHPFVDLKIIDGINLGFSSIIDMDNTSNDMAYQINLGINFDKGGAYTISDDKQNTGIGLYSSNQILPSIFNKKKKGTKQYVRMSLSGRFIEESPESSPFLTQILFPSSEGIQLRKWLEQINEYTENPDIDGLIIDLGSVSAGFAKRNEMRRALQNFKNAGKEIIVYAEYGITGSTYFLISMADKIFIAGSTGLDLKGLNIEVSFYRTLLDTLSIVPEVFRVNYNGKSYKTMGDPLLNKQMSEEMRENYTDLFESLYNIYVKGISEGRTWTKEKTRAVIDKGPYMILSKAKSAGLIDSIMFTDQFEKYVKKLNDGKNNILKAKSLNNRIEYANDWNPKSKDKIAIIYAVGGIVPGNSNPGPSGSTLMGDKTIMKAIKSARKNKDIKAIVLRIDSGGGSVLASDNMWREIYKTTIEDSSNVKPFIASMSDVAASGGYYIAMEADSILADEATITGSIGVIGLRLNFSELMKRIGVNTENITFGENADFMTGSRLLTDKELEMLQESINESYTIFKDKVIEGRKDKWNRGKEDDIDKAEKFDVDKVAMGRVFTGNDASQLDLFLIDKIGGLHDAIQVAKNTAGITGDVEIVEYPKKDSDLSIEFGLDISSIAKEELIKSLPEEVAKHYDMVELIELLSKDERQMILPYKIEVK